MTVSQATLVQRIRYELGDRPWEDTGAAASATSTITGASTGDWVEGDIGEFVEDGDTFRTVSETGGAITATRSYWGTAGSAHAASSRILKNPRYAYVEITNAISAVIQHKLWPLAWKRVGDTITPAPTTAVWYDLDGPALGLISVRQLYGTSDTKEGLYGLRHGRRVELRRNMTTSLVTSGVGLRFPDGFYHGTNTVNADYAAKLTDGLTTQLLTANQYGLETDTTGWTAVTNCAIARTTDQSYEGAASLEMTSTAGGDMEATTLTGTSGVAVTEGASYTATAYFRTAASARTVSLTLYWYNSGGNLITTTAGTGVSDATNWNARAYVAGTAPLGATRAAVRAKVAATGGASEIHYVDATTFGVTGGTYADLIDGDAVVEAVLYGAVSHLEAALENRKPRKPRQDRETLRGASMYDRMFREALNRANQELRDTIPILPRSPGRGWLRT